jgi:hypothetical protein
VFKIFNNAETLIKGQMNKEVAKPAAREIMKKKVGQEEIKSTDPWYKSRMDWQDAARNAKVYKKDYERTCPEHLSPEAQNLMWKKAKQLKDEFTVGMLSREDLHPVKGFLENGTMKYVVDEEKMRVNHSTEREVAWTRKNETKIREFKNLMRHLNPDDSNAGDIERYRPKTKM